MSVTKQVRDLHLSKEEKLRRHFDVVDECGNRTDEGTELLLDILFSEKLAEIDKRLAMLDTEEKATPKSKPKK